MMGANASRTRGDFAEMADLTGMPAQPRLTVLGAGYLGASHAACMAELGFDVLVVDADPARVAALAAGELPFFEPDLEPLLRRGLKSGRLSFTLSYDDVAAFGDVHFLCVGTPQRAGGDDADLSQVHRCIGMLAPLLRSSCLVVGKSTVPVGTASALAGELTRLSPAGDAVELAWNPEFLREGHAVEDTLRPDRIMAGVQSQQAEEMLRRIYARPLSEGTPFFVSDLITAELAKVAANSFLATKISFINAMAEVCEVAGGDVTMLAQVLGADPRIGPACLVPGLGFGGACLPKDIRAFMARAAELGSGETLRFLREVDAINLRCRTRMVGLSQEMLNGSLAGRAVGVLGAAFKPGSDDIRDSPALDVAKRMHDLGARVTVYDPVAMDKARVAYPELEYASSAVGASADAELILLLTEWHEFREADPEVLGKAVAQRKIVDGRNALDPGLWRAAGWDYRALGRPNQATARTVPHQATSALDKRHPAGVSDR
jgi:nucleotide sugar dehydrogenase